MHDLAVRGKTTRFSPKRSRKLFRLCEGGKRNGDLKSSESQTRYYQVKEGVSFLAQDGRFRTRPPGLGARLTPMRVFSHASGL
ncbi:MAG: hypothetical protein U0793_21330 [Gemmataceae bacterium]